MIKILVVCNDKFEDVEMLTPIDWLNRAGCTCDIFSSTENDFIISRSNIKITSFKKLSDYTISSLVEKYDLLFIPGGGHFVSLENDDKVISLIKEMYKAKKSIVAICAAPTILGHLGLLKGLKYTCFTSMNEDFGGIFTNNGVEIDTFKDTGALLITGKSAFYSSEFGFKIVEKFAGEDALAKLKEELYCI